MIFGTVFMKYTREQIDKIGNTIIYLTRDKALSKTKLLKLIYLLDEISVSRHGIPFLNLPYKVWKFGPVDTNLFIEFSTKPAIFSEYFEFTYESNHKYIKGKKVFCDDEFSNNDIKLLDYVKNNYALKTAPELVKKTHHKNSLWYKAAKKAGILEDLEAERISSTEILLNLRNLLNDDAKKLGLYDSYIEVFGNPNTEFHNV